MVTVPNHSSVTKAWGEFDEAGHMRPSPLYNRIVDVIEELVTLTHPDVWSWHSTGRIEG